MCHSKTPYARIGERMLNQWTRLETTSGTLETSKYLKSQCSYYTGGMSPLTYCQSATQKLYLLLLEYFPIFSSVCGNLLTKIREFTGNSFLFVTPPKLIRSLLRNCCRTLFTRNFRVFRLSLKSLTGTVCSKITHPK